jgi:hypothetical protein
MSFRAGHAEYGACGASFEPVQQKGTGEPKTLNAVGSGAPVPYDVSVAPNGRFVNPRLRALRNDLQLRPNEILATHEWPLPPNSRSKQSVQ